MTVGRRWLVGVLLAAFALQVALAWCFLSTASDEVSTIGLGYHFIKSGNWFFFAQPPLAFALNALPLLVLNPRIDLNDPQLALPRPNPWNLGLNFLALNDRDEAIFLLGRIPGLLLAILLGFFVYRWASELYGESAGVVALVLYTFYPTLIAHSGIIFYDVALTCFSTLTLYYFWRFIKDGTWLPALWSGLMLGCALASKTPAVVLLPVLGVLALVAAWMATPAPDAPSPLKALAVVVAVALGVLYTAYVFPTDPWVYVRVVLQGPELWPASYPYYLLGEFRPGGWWYYFLVAFVIKTPIPLLLLIPLALWHWWRRRSEWFSELILLLPVVAYVVLISAKAPNIGVRYLMPAFPLLFIFVSRTAPLFTRSRLGAAAGVVLLAWYVSAPLRVFPDTLAYFNELVGGPRHAVEYLDDSNVEWGQQLKRIRRYLEAHKGERIKLLYWTTGRLDYYGVRAEPMRFVDMAQPPQPGVTYIIGSHDLTRAKLYFGVDWLERYPLVDTLGYSVFVFRVS